MNHDQYQERRQQLIDFYVTNHRLPSFQEMASLFGLKSKNTVSYWVNKFIEEGLIVKDEQGKLAPAKLATPLKVLGYIHAGFPSPAEEDLLETVSLDQLLATHRPSKFMLKVASDSMVDAGIHPGDLVVVDRGKTAHTGDIVVAEVDGEWTLKRLDTQKGKVRLLPANAKYLPIIPRLGLNIGGVVTAVVRKYY